MRILFSGAVPWCNGSYGKPLRNVIPYLVEAGHQVAVACFYGMRGSVIDTVINGAPVHLYPPMRDWKLNDSIEYHAKDWEADCVISFQDVWVLENWGYPLGFLWLPWMPVDVEPVAACMMKALEGCYAPLCYSKWGTEQLVEAGWPTAKHVPLGVDLDTYKPLSREMAREAMGLPANTFIAGMVAANRPPMPCRKSFPEVLQAWRRFLDGGGEGMLYLHTTMTPSGNGDGFDFATALQQLRLNFSTLDDPMPERKERATVMFPSQYRVWCHAVDDEELARTYNAFDVLLSPSRGEGFGLPILEAQACGKPVITLNTTSMPEITFAGKCLEPVQPVWEAIGGWRGLPAVDDIVGALHWARDMAEGPQARQYLAEKARANAESLGWEAVVSKYLLPILAELE
jgi:glycosyltransferase involved in cell wall biosynthesis